MPDFRTRATTSELMDAPGVPFETFRDCLVDLARVNRLTLAYRPTLSFLDRLHAGGRLPRGRPLSILDVGSGYGDGLRRLGRWAQHRGVAVEMTGVDRSASAARAAQAAGDGATPIRWLTADLFDYEGEADVVVSSLFAHHLDDAQLTAFLAWMERTARVAWFVNDLRRSRLAYHGFAALAAVMGWHRFVRHDGPVSISRAFTVADWRRLLERTGLSESAVAIQRWFPFRLCVARTKP